MFVRFNFSHRGSQRFVVPKWFRDHGESTPEADEYWQYQYTLAKKGEPHRVPEWCMRHPDNELHQLMAKDFWSQVPKDFGSILDVGCSDGYMVDMFQRAGKRAVGINDVCVAVDKAYAEAKNIDVQIGDMHAMQFPDESIDAVWCRHTLEHSFAPLQVLFEIHRVLRPLGYLFAALPPPPGTPEPYPDHWHQIPDYQFRYLLEACNFEVLSLETCPFTFKTTNDNLEIRAVCRKAPDY